MNIDSEFIRRKPKAKNKGILFILTNLILPLHYGLHRHYCQYADIRKGIFARLKVPAHIGRYRAL